MARSQLPAPRSLPYDAIHRAILTGLLSGIAQRGEGHEYTVAGGGKVVLWPGSGLFRGTAKWVVAAEQVETTRRYLRCCARIDPRWIEPLAGHLIKRTYSDMHWESKWASAAALERLMLFGLVIVAGRPVRYGLIDPDASRQLFIEHGLVQGDLQPKPGFLAENERLLGEVELLQAKLRRSDLVINAWEQFAFYDARLPADVYDGVLLVRWLKDAAENGRTLTMTQSDLLHADQDVQVDEFPDALHAGVQIPLDYRFEPGAADDGVTATVPLEALGRLDDDAVQWLVPGMLEEKVLALIRLLPKALRTRFVPAPEAARRAAAELRRGNGSLCGQLADVLSRLGGVRVSPGDFDTQRLPAELRMNVRVVDAEGETLAAGRDLDGLRQELGAEAAAAFTAIDDTCWNRDGLTAWDFDEFPAEIEIAHGRLSMKAYPALVDAGRSVGLRLLDSRQRAEHETRFGLRRLFLFAAGREVGTQIQWLPGIEQARPVAALIEGFDLKRELADLLAQRAWPDEVEIPRTKEQFEAALASANERIGLAVQDLAGLVGPWFAAYREARAALDAAGRAVPSPQKPVAVAWGKLAAPARPQAVKYQYALDEIRDQLARLAGPRTLCTTPWAWLRHCPRYFRAVCVRLDALTGGGIEKDHERYEEFLPRWKAYLDRREQHGPQCDSDAELVRYRWMLEEYRVSLFAQKLGTSVPVSAKRLEQQWAKVGRSS